MRVRARKADDENDRAGNAWSSFFPLPRRKRCSGCSKLLRTAQERLVDDAGALTHQGRKPLRKHAGSRSQVRERSSRGPCVHALAWPGLGCCCRSKASPIVLFTSNLQKTPEQELQSAKPVGRRTGLSRPPGIHCAGNTPNLQPGRGLPVRCKDWGGHHADHRRQVLGYRRRIRLHPKPC